jgi:hypothetical protein
MKIKNWFIILLFSVSLNSFSQKKLLFYEYSLGVSLINNSKDFDNYYKGLYEEYKNTFLPTLDLNFGVGHYFTEKFDILIDLGLKTNSFKDKNQYKMLQIKLCDITGEYSIFTKNELKILLKTGIGIESTVFLYNRNNPLNMNTFEYYNTFIPVCITAANVNLNRNILLGTFLQVNIPVYKGKTNPAGIDIEMPDIPNISQNWISLGIKVRLF